MRRSSVAAVVAVLVVLGFAVMGAPAGAQSSAESEVPLGTLDNPFPAGLLSPVGSSLGLATGLGSQVDYIDSTVERQKARANTCDVNGGYLEFSGHNL